MDQVRAIAKVIWEQRFWVLSVIGTDCGCGLLEYGVGDARHPVCYAQIGDR